MKLLALFFIILLIIPSAMAGTISIRGTNVSDAQSNVSLDSTNASVTVTGWTVGTGTKIFAVKGYNASESLTFILYNFTASMVIERKDNSTSKQSYQANSTGAITFTTTQNAGNITYSFTPAENKGGLNFTWAQFWTWPSLFGVNFTQYFLPYSGATKDLDMNGKNITNVLTMNVTTTNVTLLNATDVQGNASGTWGLNATNLTKTISSDRYATGIYVANISDYESNLTGRGFVTNTTMDKNLSNYTNTPRFVTNETVNPYSYSAANATDVLPNASIPLSAMNLSSVIGIAKLHNSTDQYNIPAVTYTQVNLDTEDFDDNNECAGNQCVIAVAGKYHVVGIVYWTNTVADKSYLTVIYKNNVGIEYTAAQSSIAGYSVSPTVNTYLQLAGGDTLKLYAQSNDDTSDIDHNYTFLQYNLVRRT